MQDCANQSQAIDSSIENARRVEGSDDSRQKTSPYCAIAHISDLHFGADNQPQCWELLCQDIVGTPEIQLVLITGDVVHSPRPQFFDEACRAVTSLQAELKVAGREVKVRMVPGNHDRHYFGINLFPQIYTRGRIGRFFELFAGKVATVESTDSAHLTIEDVEWQVSWAGIDSTRRPDWFARGGVTTNQLVALKEVGTDADLCNAHLSILLVHHHPMPIAELEREASGSSAWWHPFHDNVTTLVNAGQLLEAAAEGPFDLVLHGHKHVSHVSRYSTGRSRADLIAIGAGSATGNCSRVACVISKARYNVIELYPDRTIKVRVRRPVERQAVEPVQRTYEWIDTSDPIKIFSPTGQRRARFLRKEGPFLDGEASHIKKRSFVTFTERSAIKVKSRYENWKLNENGEFRIDCENSTGTVQRAKIVITRSDDSKLFDDSVKFERQPNFIWSANTGSIGSSNERCKSIEAEYILEGAAIMTQERMKYLKTIIHLGEIRTGTNREFVAFKANESMHEGQVIARLPPAFVLEPVRVFIFRHSLENKSSGVEWNPPELEPFLEHMSRGLYRLSIPYPEQGYAYGIAWNLPSNAKLFEQSMMSPLASEFKELAREKGEQMIKTVVDWLTRTGENVLDAELYVADGTGDNSFESLKKVGKVSNGPVRQHNRQTRKESSDAWFGVVATTPENDATDRRRTDKYEVIAPIVYGDDVEIPWGLISVIGRKPPDASNFAPPHFVERFQLAILQMLAKFFSEGHDDLSTQPYSR